MLRTGYVACVLFFLLCPLSSNAEKVDLDHPLGVAVNKCGIFVADTRGNVIFLVDKKGNFNVVAGTGTAGFTGDGGPAISAELNGPSGLTVDSKCNVHFNDTKNYRVRVFRVGGNINTYAGDGTPCSPPTAKCGDGGLAWNAQINSAFSVAIDAAGNLYIADTNDNRIRKVNRKGIITTLLGTGHP